MKAKLNENHRYLLCTKCGVTMPDIEPGMKNGEFRHPMNDCRNKGALLDYDPPHARKSPYYKKGAIAVVGIQQLLPKKYRRARARGARLASKHRPK